MKRSTRLYVQDILQSIALIGEYTRDMDEEDFCSSPITQDAVQWRIEVIGEAMKKVPEEYRQQEKDIEWEEAIGMRNILVHEYFSVVSNTVWKTVTEDIPRLKPKIESLLKKLKN